MVTLVPPKEVGKSPFQEAIPLARFDPKIDTHSPGWIILMELSTGTTPPALITGPACASRTARIIGALGGALWGALCGEI